MERKPSIEIFTKEEKLAFYRKLLDVEKRSNEILVIQDSPIAVFRDDKTNKKRAEMRFQNTKDQSEYVSILLERRKNFEDKLIDSRCSITHIYNRHSLRQTLEEGAIYDDSFQTSKEQGRELLKTLKKDLESEVNRSFDLKLTSQRLGVRVLIAKDTEEVMLQYPEDNVLEGKYCYGSKYTDEFYKLAEEIAKHNSFRLKHEEESRLRVIRWLRLLINSDNRDNRDNRHRNTSPAIEALKDISSRVLKELLVKAFRLEKLKPTDIKLFYFGMNSRIHPNTLHLLTFEPADLLDIYDMLPYSRKGLYKEGYVNDILGFIPEPNEQGKWDTISAEAFARDSLFYSPDSRFDEKNEEPIKGPVSGYTKIDRILGMESTLYLPLKIEESSETEEGGKRIRGGVLLFTATNRYPFEGRIAAESSLRDSITLFGNTPPLDDLKKIIYTFYYKELSKYRYLLADTLEGYIECYNKVIEIFEFELIFKHLDLEITDRSNAVAKHINREVFENILRFNLSIDSIREDYLRDNSMFPDLIKRLDASEHRMMLSQKEYRNHTAHMFNVLCLGNVFLSNVKIRDLCKKYLIALLNSENKKMAEIAEIAEIAVNIILDHFWHKNSNPPLTRFIEINRITEDLWDFLVYLMWFVIATNHDIARNLENTASDIVKLLKDYNVIDTKETDHPLQGLIVRAKEMLVDKWNEASWKPSNHENLFPFNETRNLKDYVKSIDRTDDHAHLSALSVWNNLVAADHPTDLSEDDESILERLVFSCAWTILLHHLPKAKIKDAEYKDAKFSFEKYPFLGLLILCDSLQLWGRKSAKGEDHGESDEDFEYDLFRPLISVICDKKSNISIRFDTREPSGFEGDKIDKTKEKQESQLKSLSKDIANVADLLRLDSPEVVITVMDNPIKIKPNSTD